MIKGSAEVPYFYKNRAKSVVFKYFLLVVLRVELEIRTAIHIAKFY